MNSRTPVPASSDYPGVTRRSCPVCGPPINRIPRRLLDRITTLFSSKRRYRCRGFSCQWEGLLPAGAERHSRSPDSAL